MFLQRTKEQRFVVLASGILACLVVLGWLGVFFFGNGLVNSILSGEGPLSYLRSYGLRLVGGYPPGEQAAELAALIRTYLGRLTIVYLFCQALILIASQRYENLFHDFFHEETHAVNLAIFRVAFFATLYPRPSLRKILGLLELPESSRVAPPGLGWWVANLSESPELHTWLYRLFLVACFFGVIGLGTRWACVVAGCLTMYLMGITQFFGKIEHQHHLVWVAFLLAASRCGDALSVDAWLRRRNGSHVEIGASRAYALPLRFIWLFLGVMYFFPGLWKFVVSGPEWFLSQNLESRMLLRQFIGEGWQLPLPIYEYPLLCTLGGLITILMEVGFIFLILLPGWRYLAAVGGFSFHWMVKWFLNISFWPVPIYYIAFVDWVGLWRIARKKFATKESDSKQAISTCPAVGPARTNLRFLFAVGMLFVIGNAACGFVMLDSWPFGVYPTFARVIGPTFQSVSFCPVDASGQELVEVEALFDPTIREAYGVGIGRMGDILGTILRTPKNRADRLRALWEHWERKQSTTDQIVAVNFYLIEYSTKPSDKRKRIRRVLLETIQR